MPKFKRLVMFTIILALCGAGAYGWYVQSVYHAVVEAGRAAKAQDAKRFEKFVNLDAMGENTTKFYLDIKKEEASKKMGPLGRLVVGGLANVFGSEIAAISGTEIATTVREKITAGEDLTTIGPFHPLAETFPPVSVVESGDGFVHTAHRGTCHGEETSITVVWMRAPGEIPVLKTFLQSWRAQSVTRASLKDVVEACARGEAKAKKDG